MNAKTDGKWTPLHFATWNGRLEIIKLLVENGADINAKNGKGMLNLSFFGDTPLDLAKDERARCCSSISYKQRRRITL